jgi:hypothetical protein
MNDLWLPDGHHWDLHIEHHPSSNDAGSFTGGGNKFVLHTTEGGNLRSNSDLLHGVNTPHLLFGVDPGEQHWTVIQFLPFNRAGKTLQNDVGDGFQTNRANAIQMEIVAFTDHKAASDSRRLDLWIPNWSDLMYKRLANVLALVRHRADIPSRAPLDFSSLTNRMSDAEWVRAAGIFGHMHAPDNSHIDPFRLREGFLVELLKDMPAGGYQL